ncbi:hypothetical protein BOTCAL_0258g00040 [Botryotinia calthae]|uniref:Uncharacterized protein n=1 Tax=Botryotinia calthae TaxID=38488 RepID=A0A4Y8CW94_9HELO|nr:hypothetical protein BOTCAL_0258g00040 [Botryotinia calthae]
MPAFNIDSWPPNFAAFSTRTSTKTPSARRSSQRAADWATFPISQTRASNVVFLNSSDSLEADLWTTSLRRPTRITLEAEAEAYALAMENPIPADAPVIRTVLPTWHNSGRKVIWRRKKTCDDFEREEFTRRLVADECWLSLRRKGSYMRIYMRRPSVGLLKAAAWRNGNNL